MWIQDNSRKTDMPFIERWNSKRYAWYSQKYKRIKSY